MDWGAIATILLGILGLIGSVIGYVLARQNRDANRIQKLEAEKRTEELRGIGRSIERVHDRIDDVEETQKTLLHHLNDGDNGIFVRLSKLETVLKMGKKDG